MCVVRVQSVCICSSSGLTLFAVYVLDQDIV